MIRKQTRIPTLLAIAILALVSLSGYVVSNNTSLLFGQAKQPTLAPLEVKVSNVNATSFAVSWKTQIAIPSYIRYKTNTQYQKAYDVRDSDKIAKSYIVHYVEITQLPQNSGIPWEIVVGDKSYPQEPVTTAPSFSNPPQILPIYGALENSDATSNKGTILFVELKNNALSSMFIDNTAKTWVFPLALMRTADGVYFYCQKYPCDENTPLTLSFVTEEGTQTIQTTIGASRPLTEIKPTPTSNVASPTPKVSPSPKVKGTTSTRFSIISPENKATLRFAQPLFRGTGISQAEVSFVLKSNVTQVGKTTVRSDGTWLWTPPLPLVANNYILTATSKDSGNKTVTLSRSFTIAKSGEQVLAGATAAATLTPTSKPIVSPTATPTAYPTTIPATPTPTMPKTGAFAPSLLLIGGGATLLLLGLTLL